MYLTGEMSTCKIELSVCLFVRPHLQLTASVESKASVDDENDPGNGLRKRNFKTFRFLSHLDVISDNERSELVTEELVHVWH